VTADDDGPAAGGDLSVYLRFSRRVGRRDPRGTNLALKAKEPRTRRAYPGGYGDSLLGIKRCEADDGAPVVAEVALAASGSGIVEIAGPERAPFNEIVARYLKAVGDPREVVRDPEALYWAVGSRSTRSCRWARRASAISVSTNGSAARRQGPDPACASGRIVAP